MLTCATQAETINKLLKRQAPKTSRRNGHGGDDMLDDDAMRADPVFIRWISSKEGSLIGVPDEIVQGPAGRLFNNGVGRRVRPRRMVEEVA